MPTTDALQGLPSARFAHLLLVDGIGLAFTDNEILVPGSFTGVDGHDVRNYLITSNTELEELLNPRSGQLDHTTATFVLHDVDREGVLPDLFRAVDPSEAPLDTTIYPGDSAAAQTEVHNLNVGTERFGAAGERHLYPVVSGFALGDMHIGADQELPHHRPAPITRDPIVWRGRRCALYRCYIDTDGTRRPYSEAQRIWWGTITDQGMVNGREWSIEADGPLSWLQREFGILTQRDPVPAIGSVVLSSTVGQDETRIGVTLSRRDNVGTNNEEYGQRDFTTALTGATPADIIAELSAELATASGSAGADGAFDAADNRWVSIDATGQIGIHTDEGSDGEAVMSMSLHHKVWAALGYDPTEQDAREPGSEYYVRFAYYASDGEGVLGNGGAPNGDPPGSGYLIGSFFTRERGNPFVLDNNGNPRYFKPLYAGGTSVLLADLNGGEGQIVDLGDGFGSTIIYHRGQLSRPIAGDPDDPTSAYPINGGANRQGLWLFYGKRREGEREFDDYQVARASWRAGSIGQQGQVIGSQIVVTEWLTPRRFGFDVRRISSDWVIRSNAEEEYRVRAVPIIALDYRAGLSYERADVVVERMLRTTGTSTGWSSYNTDPAASLDGGDNDSAGIVRRDAEHVDYGCAIPDSMVANILSFALVYDGLPDSLGDVKVAFSPGTPTSQIFESLTRPFGLSFTLRGGRYGVHDPFTTPSPEDIDFVLSGATKAVDIRAMRESETGQELRALAPIDRFELEYSWAPHQDRNTKKYTVDSKDVGRRYRHGGVVDKINGMGMRSTAGWGTRMRTVGEWWARRHFIVQDYPYLDRALRHVGEFCRLTDPRGVNPEGTYGITQMIAKVIGVRTVLRPGPGEPHAYLTLLVYANTATTPRLHAMSARAFGIDTDNNRIYVRDNWLGFYGDPWPGDASYFVEPTFAGVESVGGDLEITIVQWDGGWRSPVTGRTVTGTGSDGTGAYLQLDGAPSEYFHRMDTIVIAAPRGTVTAQWALDYYGVTCAEDGEFGTTSGFRWEDL